MDITDISSIDEHLAKRVTPALQRLLHPNPDEEDTNQVGQDTKTTVFNLRRLVANRKVPIEKIHLSTKKVLDIAEAKMRAGLDDGDLQAVVVDQAAEIANLKAEIETLRSTAAPAPVPEPATVPALAKLDRVVGKAGIKLGAILMDITEFDDNGTLISVAQARAVVQAWYSYRRASKPLPELTTEQWAAAELMDAIYLSYKDFDDGRKQVQDALNYHWWKIVYPGAKVTLNGQFDPTHPKISFNSQPSR